MDIPVPNEIKKSLNDFQADHPDPEKVGFIMMRFKDIRTQRDITNAITKAALGRGVKALRADQHLYSDILILNVKTYMWGCGFGFAVFDQISSKDEEYNPNIAFEVGYMHALQKRLCLLKDQTVKSLQSDLGGKIYFPFDAQDADNSIKQAIDSWWRSHEKLPPPPQQHRMKRITTMLLNRIRVGKANYAGERRSP